MTLSSFSRFLWLLCTTTFLVFNSFNMVQGQCHGNQRTLLLQLKRDFNATSQGNKIESWDALSKDCCKWAGVSCNGGYVTGLDLSGEGIVVDSTGFNDTSALFELRNLTTLNLAQNSFDTTIPPAFAKLGKLLHLILTSAGFQGQIPIEISTLTRLVTLDISSDKYFGLRAENPNLQMLVGNLSNLVKLNLRTVDLSTQTSDWCQVLSSSLPHLQVLNLAHTSLSGTIDPSLQNLKFPSILDLSYNTFSAPFPNFLSNLRNLTYLKIDNCGLSGISEKMFQMPSLRFLDLTSNFGLVGSFPKTIKNSSLETLLLGSTTLWKTIPDSIGQLKKLKVLNLYQCGLEGHIPNSISQLTNLVSVTMPSNNLNGSIPLFSLAKNLRELDLSNNGLTGSIESTDWKQLTHLETIVLQGNSLTGKIPISLFGIPSLRMASLSGNTFTGFTKESITPSTQLKHLSLGSNNIHGEFPSFIFGLHGLQALDISDNNFGTTLQLASLNQLKNLTYLYLSRSNLSVEIGTETALFPQLTKLGLVSCGLKEIPRFLKNHSAIDDLDLSQNLIQGLIPSWIWDIDTLNSLTLRQNYLQGFEISNSSSHIKYVDLRDNLLHGKLPHLVALESLQLSSNHFNSTLSSIISNFGADLSTLAISRNNLYGSIPESVCDNMRLFDLDLSENFLSGAIPECMPNIETIGTLNLRKNNISGISDTITAKCRLSTVDLSENILRGSIPKSLGNCSSLSSLDLSDNNFEKMIPYEFGHLEYLRSVNVSHNKLTGTIPTSLGNLTSLTSLDLSKNQLSGRIPRQFENLTMLSFFNVSYNQLVGAIPKGPQFEHLTEASFEGNKGLCGIPLKNKC